MSVPVCIQRFANDNASRARAAPRQLSPHAVRLTACTVNGLAWTYVCYLAGCAAWAELLFAGVGFASVAVAIGAP